MTTEAPERSIPRPVPTTMPVGGAVVPVVPQSVEEIFRVSKGVVQSGLAPYALTGKTDTEDGFNRGVSAVAIVIMAGAELGLPPMVSLRSFTAINGRPALYGDGLINVVRRSGRASMLKVGYTNGIDYKLFIQAELLPEPEDDEERALVLKEFMSWPIERRTGGYCKATRGDTGETKVVIFTVAQAMRAGLWQTADMVEKEVWEDKPGGGRHKVKRTVPNDSPWYRYPERMLGWRAAGFCLRDLFGDVLGGITDDWEAREIGGMVDITPQSPPTNGRPQPPQAPLPEDENQDASNEAESATAPAADATNQADDATEGMTLAEADVARQAELHNSDQPAGAENEVGDDENPTQPGGADTTSTTSKEEPEAESSTLTTAEPPIAPEEPPEPGSDEWFERLEIYLKETKTVDDIEDLWTHLDIESELSSTSIATMDRADELKKHHVARVGGQGDLLGGQ